MVSVVIVCQSVREPIIAALRAVDQAPARVQVGRFIELIEGMAVGPWSAGCDARDV
jgi:hypothetical protein